MNATDFEEETCVLRIELRDALVTAGDDEEGGGMLIPAQTTCVLHVRAPRRWLDGDALREDRLERVYETMYGATWREGNIDGSYFRVLHVDVAVLSDAVVRSRVWCAYDEDDPERRYWFWCVGDDEALIETTAEEL
jgi:hypothetical protein